ncbi:MAG: ATP-binding cassette domain-containing protein, partial [Candidatus Latescibacteria bacterium]|nr:ATP-binding cassette domain-containing protein [Candidatus Latescibacterota bacterium]
MIELAGIEHRYAGGVPALAGLDLSIREGEKVVLLGANGCGKTTLLKILDGLLFPISGAYRYDGRAETRRTLRDDRFQRRFRSEVAHLFQNPDATLFNPTVRDEIAFGLRQLGLRD